MKKRLSYFFSLILTILISHQNDLFAQQTVTQNFQSFGINEGYERLYANGVYYLKSISSGELKSFESYRYIGDVTNGSVVFKSQDGHYGVLNNQFQEVIQPEWIEVKDLGFGYFALAHYSGIMVTEDRGNGHKDYAQLTWKLFSVREMEFVSDMELINPICIYGEVLAQNIQGEDLRIQLGKINLGYHDPLMKAISIVQKIEKSTEHADLISKSK